jgi:hypothetical protein
MRNERHLVRMDKTMDMSDKPNEQPHDATPEALRWRLGAPDPRQIAAWRAMSPARRLELAFQAYPFALEAARLTERQRCPDLPADGMAWRVTRHMQGNPKLGR